MISSVWYCPACNHKEKHTDMGSVDALDGFWMECECSRCDCYFMVNVASTEEE